MDVLERVADHADAHVDQVRGGHLEHLLGELLTVLVDLLQQQHTVHTSDTGATIIYGYPGDVTRHGLNFFDIVMP